MEILQLKYFCDAALCENFSLTAKKYGVPPSDISQSIKRLEVELGAPLFKRGANRISLNERGRVFYDKVSEALALIADATETVGEGFVCSTLRICVNCHRRIVMQTIEKFKAAMPAVNIEMTTFKDPSYSDYDIIVSSDSVGYDKYRRKRLLSERLLLAVPSGHRLAGRDLVDPAELSGESFIAMSELSALTEYAERIYRAGGFTPKVTLKTDDPLYFRRGIEMGLGVAIVPELSWRGQFSDNVKLIPVGDFSRDVCVYTDKTDYRGGAVGLFLVLLEEEIKNEN